MQDALKHCECWVWGWVDGGYGEKPGLKEEDLFQSYHTQKSPEVRRQGSESGQFQCKLERKNKKKDTGHINQNDRTC